MVDKLDIDELKNVLTNLSNLKSKVDKLDVDKLVPASVDLNKLSDIVKNYVVKKDVCNTKIKNIGDKIPDITNLATNITLNAKIYEVKGEISSITNLTTTTFLNGKISEVKNKIPNITNLTTAVLTTVEDKIPNVINLVKKTEYKRKIKEIGNKITTDNDHDKYVTTQEFNKLTSENVTRRLVQGNLATKKDFANFVTETDFDNKLKNVTSNKNELNGLARKLKTISTKGLTKDLINKLSILNGAKYFSLRTFQNYLVFIPAKKYIKHFSDTTRADC